MAPSALPCGRGPIAIGTAFHVIFHSPGALSETFARTILPDLGPDRPWVVRYLDTMIPIEVEVVAH